MPQDSNANEQTPESVEPTPVFERESPKEDIIPEELPEETPEDLTVSDIEGGSSGDDFTIPPPESVSFSEGGSKKYVAIGIGVVIVILLFIGILTFLLSLRGNKKEITLEYWGLWEDEQVFAPIIEEYHRNNPKITVKYVKQDPQSYREKLIARGKEGRGPDIFRFHNTWLPSIIETENIRTSPFFTSCYKLFPVALRVLLYIFDGYLRIVTMVFLYYWSKYLFILPKPPILKSDLFFITSQ